MNTGKEEKIRQRAYEIWQREGRPSGRDQDHWSQAQAEITREEREGNLGATGAMGGNSGGQSQASASSVADASSGEEASRRGGRRGRKPKAEGEAPKRRTTTRPRNK